MPAIQINPLPDLQRPLAEKFYRVHASGMRARGQIWVVKQGEIVGVLCLSPVPGGQWLTGLFVVPELRGQGLAQRLIETAIAAVEGCVWLFCDPELSGFYQRMGFIEAELLPQPLSDRLTRYRQSKALLALVLDPLSRSSKPNV
jgi:GNAT superfamily N-acetyltransferase